MRTFMACMVALWAAGGWGSAYAGTPGPGAAALDDQVTVAGEAHDTPRVATQGEGVPLRIALRRMVPVIYSINLPNAGAWAATPVTWSAGHSLAQTLREMLASHPELAAQIDTDFQLVTVRYRQPFGSDTVGALVPSTAAAPSPAPLPSGSVAAAASASGVVVGGPLGTGPASTKLPEGAAPAVGKASPAGLAPRLSAQQFAQTGAPAVRAPAPATQAERTPAMDSPGAGSPAPGAARGTVAGGGTSTRGAPGTPSASGPSAPSAASGPRVAGAQAPTPEAPVQQTWRIELSDRTVRGALTRWTQEAGWRLIWEAPVDFAVDAPAMLTGTFDEALQSVIGALSSTDAPVQAILYRGNKVLRIVEKGAG
ncbi:TcpQ domain-containing protein [Trinickia caryophylli]|uniref:Toxin co-regulated pilus biosynthesis protein Q n=1 Tax=Trinickia caryophylli TaxID=28094 RepID=A0A1X7EDU0_TRICW|nr:toxin co-regulated pilus biosynthesis Q family protein [Trinickia caryophylli]PMS12872.1 hypothetical protein C0Z17_06080 [Trinickia caryophylli]TRX14623.1 hypothetical protein FNF07_25585 [Trinickia caryophylli]WQE14467.1 TcpQ domain-containing protein [Trinickia caryophylli]SMF32129.1 Toxin co-regulated pilus biosynthesis protein Q [Trinickia caryophylli]GLU32130.1 hypothetical protein Busp01_19720 [Trinickia caryophylli]